MLFLTPKLFVSELRLVNRSLMTVSRGRFKPPPLLVYFSKPVQVTRKPLIISSSLPIGWLPGVVLAVKGMTVCLRGEILVNQPLKVSLWMKLMCFGNAGMLMRSSVRFRMRLGLIRSSYRSSWSCPLPPRSLPPWALSQPNRSAGVGLPLGVCGALA
jgi:hypothetical protein